MQAIKCVVVGDGAEYLAGLAHSSLRGVALGPSTLGPWKPLPADRGVPRRQPEELLSLFLPEPRGNPRSGLHTASLSALLIPSTWVKELRLSVTWGLWPAP